MVNGSSHLYHSKKSVEYIISLYKYRAPAERGTNSLKDLRTILDLLMSNLSMSNLSFPRHQSRHGLPQMHWWRLVWDAIFDLVACSLRVSGSVAPVAMTNNHLWGIAAHLIKNQVWDRKRCITHSVNKDRSLLWPRVLGLGVHFCKNSFREAAWQCPVCQGLLYSVMAPLWHLRHTLLPLKIGLGFILKSVSASLSCYTFCQTKCLWVSWCCLMLVSCRMWRHGQELFLTSCTLRLWIGYLCRHNHREDRAIQHHLAATRHLFLHDRCAQNKGQRESSTRKLDEQKLPEVKIFNRNTIRTAEKTRGNQSTNGYMTPVNSRVWIPPSSPNLFSHGPDDDHVWPWGLVPGSFGAPVRPDSTPQSQTTSKELSKLLELWRCIPWRCNSWCFRNPAPPDMWMFTISFSCVRSRILLSCAGLTLFFHSLVKVRP